MKLSIVIPTYNNLKYLKFTIDSIINNSKYEHEIVLHINEGTDGTLDFAKQKKIKFSYSDQNLGLCKSVNLATKEITTDYILYSHDDMFFCYNWDEYLKNEIMKYEDNMFYLTGTNVSTNMGLINFDCGSSPENFNEKKFNDFCKKDNSQDLQGSHWAPHLIHKDLWLRVGGSDPDLCMKLWKQNVRIFKTISKFKVYHFSSITTRKSKIELNNGTKTFLLKYGFNPRFFRKYYLKGDNKKIFDGKLKEPSYSLSMIIELIINKIKYYYFNLFK